ncbi:hypothetical protein ANCDUO_00812 [Ancylostoma duodenale]|uniref:Uncharacterized protein n=1 Tax=Ancylostoma duodenale TaxID=51022 RepID=A0A0C2HB46_9BILA|nr:hypothetical protein ANCDUO_00812 [Ancylostoma duodenale]
MAPRKQAQPQFADEASIWLQAILKRWDDYFSRLDKMFEFMLKVQDSQNAILNKITALEERLLANSEQESQSKSALCSMLVKFRADAKIIDAKSCGITWVGRGEQENENATRVFDREALKEVIESFRDEDLLRELNGGKIDIHRRPQSKPIVNNGRPRIIKIYVRNRELRARLLLLMRARRTSLTQEFVHSYARTDYTREEINYDRSLRKSAGITKQREGKLPYVVRDLAIHKLRSPRELPTKPIVNPLSLVEHNRSMDESSQFPSTGTTR